MINDILNCDFCYRMCSIPEGSRGACGAREHKEGRLQTIGYGRVLTAAVDPVEKKPFFHIFPGEKTLSISLYGCNFRCDFCQNSEVSQPDGFYSPDYEHAAGLRSVPEISPERIVEIMRQKNLNIMCYTYSDPIVWQDYMIDTARYVKKAGGYNLMVTNGSFSPTSLERVLPHIDGFNVDVKGDDQFYKSVCKGSLSPVLSSIERIAKDPRSVLEVTTMIIEGIHTVEGIRELGQRLHESGVEVWHLSRFFPHYRMEDRAATSEVFLARILEAVKDSPIPHIYAGNSINLKHEKTICPVCGATLINSHSYRGEARYDVARTMKEGSCTSCGTPVYGLFT